MITNKDAALKLLVDTVTVLMVELDQISWDPQFDTEDAIEKAKMALTQAKRLLERP